MPYIIKGETADWEVIIGLEIHCQVISQAKLFSNASTKFGAEPNTQVSFVDSAQPGMLPVINDECVKQAIRTGLGLNAEINKQSQFARKNYFYADLPQGYQISQTPGNAIVGKGSVTIDTKEDGQKTIGITQLHLEQDAGALLHDQHPTKSYVDLNRVGTALMEIVSEPDIRSPEEAGEYWKKIRSIVRYLGTCDGNMDQGSMRADVNISVRKVGETEYRTRCEIKNMNSVRFMQMAIEYEARRQVELYEEGKEVDQETRSFNKATGVTATMRSKEDAHDYRYFPEPDLLPLILTDEEIEECRATLPELPDAKRARFISEFGLTDYDAGVLTVEKEVADYFERAVGSEKKRDGKMVANFMQAELFGHLNKDNRSITESPVSAESLGKLIDRIQDDTISGKIAKAVFEDMFETSRDPDVIIEEKGLRQITDTSAIEKVVDEIMAANEDKVAEVRSGKDKMISWFVGQLMQQTGGKVNPGMANKILRDKLLG